MSATTSLMPGATVLSLPKGARFGLCFKPMFSNGVSSKSYLSNGIFLKNSRTASRKSMFTGFRPFSPVMEWQDCVSERTWITEHYFMLQHLVSFLGPYDAFYLAKSLLLMVILQAWYMSCPYWAKIEVDVPCKVAYDCYSDREAIPQWMPFISSVKVLDDKPDLSRWSLKYEAFGRDLEFSWMARNMQPIPNQKIHWRSLEGLPNRGAVRFYPKGPSSCSIELTVSYEVPQILTPVASALKPFLEGLLLSGLERFATFAKGYKADSPRRPK